MVTRWYCYAKMDFTCFIIRQNKQGLDQNGILLTLSEKSVRQLSNILPQKSDFHCFYFPSKQTGSGSRRDLLTFRRICRTILICTCRSFHLVELKPLFCEETEDLEVRVLIFCLFGVRGEAKGFDDEEEDR